MSHTIPPTAPHPSTGPEASRLRSERVDLGRLGTREALLVCEAAPGVDAPSWAARKRAEIDALLAESGALLLRGFGVVEPREFVRIAEALSSGIEADYSELPRHASGERCYRSTPYSESLPILFHNEAAHRTRWPRRQFFCCIEPASDGGATPLVDGRDVLARLDSAIVEALRERGLLYLRNFSSSFDLDWPSYYGSDSKADVEAICERDETDAEWTATGLRTWQRLRALERAPETGEELPFHQILLHHPRCLPGDVRRALEAEFAEDAMPRNVFFGDGERIEDDLVDEILRAYSEAAVRFAWRRGDVLVFDNLRIAHARDSFSGPRTMLVALGAFVNGSPPDQHQARGGRA